MDLNKASNLHLQLWMENFNSFKTTILSFTLNITTTTWMNISNLKLRHALSKSCLETLSITRISITQKTTTGKTGAEVSEVQISSSDLTLSL